MSHHADYYEGFDGESAALAPVTSKNDGPFTKYRAIDRSSSTLTESFPSAASSFLSSFQPSRLPVLTLPSATTTCPSSSSYPSSACSTSPNSPLFHTTTFTTSCSSSSSSTSITRCPEKPIFLSPTTFYTQQSNNLPAIKTLVEKALVALEEDGYDWSFTSSSSSSSSSSSEGMVWKCKYLQGSNLREYHVSCYYDSIKGDHLLEVKRVRGDGLSLMNSNTSSNITSTPSVDFYTKLRKIVLGGGEGEGGENIEEDEDYKQRMTVRKNKLRGPLPLIGIRPLAPIPTTTTTSTSTSNSQIPPVVSLARTTSEMTEEQFLQGLIPIQSMVNETFFESRLEAAKMLCDLISSSNTNNTKKYLENPIAMNLILKSIEKLIHDDFMDIKQFIVIAFAGFCSLKSYCQLFLQSSSLLYEIIPLINNSAKSVLAYTDKQMRRQAAYGLSLIVSQCQLASEKVILRQILQSFGYINEEKWLDHCSIIFDKATRNYAKEVASAYNA